MGSTNTTLGFHGYIALTVFARSDDVTQGAVTLMETARDEVSSSGSSSSSSSGGGGGSTGSRRRRSRERGSGEGEQEEEEG